MYTDVTPAGPQRSSRTLAAFREPGGRACLSHCFDQATGTIRSEARQEWLIRYACTSSVIHPIRLYPYRMSHSIQIRNVPDDVHRTLRTRAAAAGTSLSDYLLRDITRLAERPSVADVIIRAGSRSGGADVDAIVEAVRSGRDRP